MMRWGKGGKGGWFDFNYELTHLRFVQTPTQVRPEQADFFLPNVSIIFTIVSLFLSLSHTPFTPFPGCVNLFYFRSNFGLKGRGGMMMMCEM